MKGPESHGYTLKVDGSGNVIGWEPLRTSLLGNNLSSDTDTGTPTKSVLFAYNLTLDDGTISLLSAQDSGATIVSGDPTLDVNAQLYAHDGADFARLRAFAGNADNVTSPTSGLLGSASFSFAYDAAGGNWDRVRLGPDNADAVAVATAGLLFALSRGYVFNGSTWDRQRAANLFARVSCTAAGNTEVVAAPGAGNHIRLMGYRISTLGTVAVAAIQDMVLRAGAATVLPFGQLNNMQATNNGTVNPSWCPIPNGYALPSNTALNLNLPTALATGASVAEVHYLIEAD